MKKEDDNNSLIRAFVGAGIYVECRKAGYGVISSLVRTLIACAFMGPTGKMIFAGIVMAIYFSPICKGIRDGYEKRNNEEVVRIEAMHEKIRQDHDPTRFPKKRSPSASAL